MNRFPLRSISAATAALTLLALAGCAEPGPECVPIGEQKLTRGTQGYKIWTGETLRSFTHRGRVVCVPEGWRPVGELEAGDNWATFPPKQTGVIVRKDAFAARIAQFENTAFDVKIVWPLAMPDLQLAAANTLIERTFTKVGSLYPRFPEEPATLHTVLVTAGVAGDTSEYEGRVYPEPGPNLTVVFREPHVHRSEELLIHAVAHLYNRHRRYWIGDQESKLPVPVGDWEELVATWTETAFVSRHNMRLQRLEYMYRVHTAIQTDDFSLITGPPFDEPEGFKRIKRDVVVRRPATEMDYGYGHYILGPLTMVGTQGLLMRLAEEGTIAPTSVEALLIEVGAGKHDSFFAALEQRLPDEEMERILGWMHGGQTIDRELVFSAAEHYARLQE